MQIKYIKQPHQEKAIKSVIDIFEGQIKQKNYFDIFDGEAVCFNELSLPHDEILQNLHEVQKQNGIEKSENLESLDFSVEMETGTGKTFVYIKTILELHVKYGFSKYIIIVPSIAIKEGVLNSLNSMEEYFKGEYNFVYDYFEYESNKLSLLKNFIRNDGLEIMVMTIDSFKRANTILNMPREGFIGSPKQSLKKTNPILILDEPQNMESELSKSSISELNPLFTLRYSATHKNYYNLCFSLTPKDALENGLVKQIDVLALSENQSINDIYINVKDIQIDKKLRRPVASLELVVKNKDEFIKKIVKIKSNDSLKQKSKNPIYQGFIVDEIVCGSEKYISFENGLKCQLHEVNGEVNKQIQKEQISEAIKRHMEKYEELKRLDIKVLSLFFIDKVSNFLESENGWIEEYFCKEFDRLKVDFESFKKLDAKDVYAYYFAKRKASFVDELKNNESDRKLQKQMYEIIMKSKEKLLSFEENKSFIFSHSALKEGWDNPNVFFITTLNDTKSDMKKRQILGRGVRLCVNSKGQRIESKEINRLTVIANESFEEFAKSVQLEYEISGDKVGVSLNNVKNKKQAKRRYSLEDEELKEFRELWEKLKQKTRYKINLDSKSYQKSVVRKLKEIEVKEKKITKSFGNLKSNFDLQIQEEKSIELNYEESLPNIVEVLEKEIGLCKNTIIEIFEELGIENFAKEFIKNSDSYIKQAIEIFEDCLYEILSSSDGLVYEKNGKYYEFSNIFPSIIEGYNLEDNLKGLYESEEWDSQVEQNFIKDVDKKVKFFTKLPKKFKIKTPIGSYSPDFAVIKYDQSEGSFIVETKGSKKERDLKEKEKWKIAYAKKHFKMLDIKYKDKITRYEEL